MEIINLCSHPVNVIVRDEELAIPPATKAVRIGTKVIEKLDCEVPMLRVDNSRLDPLPEPVEDTLYIVSTIVRIAHPHRYDIASPGGIVKDETGKVIGCRCLYLNAPKQKTQPQAVLM